MSVSDHLDADRKRIAQLLVDADAAAAQPEEQTPLLRRAAALMIDKHDSRLLGDFTHRVAQFHASPHAAVRRFVVEFIQR
jgi:hypothetical protein